MISRSRKLSFQSSGTRGIIRWSFATIVKNSRRLTPLHPPNISGIYSWNHSGRFLDARQTSPSLNQRKMDVSLRSTERATHTQSMQIRTQTTTKPSVFCKMQGAQPNNGFDNCGGHGGSSLNPFVLAMNRSHSHSSSTPST